MNRRTLEKIISVLFATATAALWVTITIFDFAFSRDTTVIKYVGILLCFLYSVYAFIKGAQKSAFVVFALLFTLIADYFLLVKNADYLAGVSAFCVAQAAYFLRIYYEKGKFPLVSVCVRSACFCSLSVALLIFRLAEPLTIAVCFYACMLVANAVESFSLVPKNKKFVAFAVGLCLLACCDVCVGIYNLGSFVGDVVPPFVAEKFVLLSWVFYLPSQALISLSADA